jgi:hypothetical protein
LQKNIEILSSKIKHQQILEGEPYNYEMLKKYCQFICWNLPKHDKILQADILIQLGIEGGDYCGAGIFHAVERCFAQLLYQSRELSLETRILLCLQHKREEIWQQIYYTIWKIHPLYQLLGFISNSSGIHTYHRYINFSNATHKFGIVAHSALQDPEAYVTPSSYLSVWLIRSRIQRLFWNVRTNVSLHYFEKITPKQHTWKVWKHYKQKKEIVKINGYSVDLILEELNHLIGSPLLPKSEIYKWWQNWIERQSHLSDEEKEVHLESLADTKPTLFGESITLNGDKINPKFLKAMLIEMGILQLDN